MPIFYTAVEQFDVTWGESWRKYIEWCGLKQLKEVVSLDSNLCRSYFLHLTDEDWRHNVHEDYKLTLFHDLDYVVRRIDWRDRVNVLAVMHNPAESDARTFTDAQFRFRGYDLVEAEGGTGISALVNCGGFDQSFSAPNSPSAAY